MGWLLPALVLGPAVGALAAYAHRSATFRNGWLLAVAVGHLAGVVALWNRPATSAIGGWLAIDALSLIVLTLVSVLFFVTAFYAVGFLRTEKARGGRIFVSCLLGFLAAASLVALSHHMALVWVGMESVTLALAPLVYHRHDRRSLEAVWKYLVLSSVGIALALFGTFFLAAAQTTGRPLVIEDLVAGAGSLQPALLRAAFIFLLVGYGTKMGLAPLHAWKPDTYGEAPGLVAGLMAGALTSCAFLALARTTQVTHAAGLQTFVQPLLLAFGLVSLGVGAVFMLGQMDLKRLLAYSSVEHMGLLALGLGFGGAGAYGSTLHVVNNGLSKGLLFLTASNLALAVDSNQPDGWRGVLRRLPISGVLLLVGLFAVTGSPPFGPFVSVFTIFRSAIDGGHPWIAVTVVGLLALGFVGMGGTVLRMLYTPGPAGKPPGRESVLLIGGPIALAVVLVMLGVYLPAPLQHLLADAAQALGGRSP